MKNIPSDPSNWIFESRERLCCTGMRSWSFNNHLKSPAITSPGSCDSGHKGSLVTAAKVASKELSPCLHAPPAGEDQTLPFDSFRREMRVESLGSFSAQLPLRFHAVLPSRV